MSTAGPTQVMEQPAYVRILTLNGGGARCWSALLILEKVMKNVSRSGQSEVAKPCEYFHLIVGSEWGAVLAVLLGRLRLSVKDCQNWLRRLHYPLNWSILRILPGVTTQRSKYYKQKFRELICQYFPESQGDLPFYDGTRPEDHAVTLVLATDPANVIKPRRFRCYPGTEDAFEEPDMSTPIWKVALAAIATPLDLDPVTFPASDSRSEYSCIASSLAGFSNPSWIGLLEAQTHFSPNSVHTVLNIGCGGEIPSNWPMSLGNPLPVIRGIALTKMIIGQVNDASGAAAHQMMRESANLGFYYQYLAAPTVDTSYYNWSEQSRKQMEERTEKYLVKPEIKELVTAVAKKLVKLADVRNMIPDTSRPSNHVPRTRDRRLGPPLIDIEEEPLVDGQEASQMLRNESRATLESPLRLPSRGPTSKAGQLQHPDLDAGRWLLEFKKTLDLLDCYDEASPSVRVAILDTGIDSEHPWIRKHWKHRSRLPHYKEFTMSANLEEPIPTDETGHGTHMAGLILQTAPEVDLYVLRVFTDRNFVGGKDSVAMARVREAMLYAVDTLEVNVISMSFAFEGGNDNALDSAITRAMEKNVTMLAAASNSGNEKGTYYPACDRRVFRVNSVNAWGNRMYYNPQAGLDDNNDNLAILGVDILSTWPMHLPGGYQEPGKEGNWKQSSGTSCSTAILSGIAALTIDFGRILRARPEFQANSREAAKIWKYVDRPQGLRYLFWQMAGGRNNRTSDQFSDVRPWRLLSIEKDISEIGKLYLDALRLGREGMA
ncbi:peptidase S8/S53 domain-containing protein [Lophiotrema nucula]|uniref:Peptidase S8/S53 domain-containing protein n=1 Tax=Lophiotrema nucula TaxID=690887 RepID=A0A6A5ZKY8_9PLEO|nr:peptidase S8/S53 domain-containing protein [Lophiotrema nucula]